MIYFSGKILDTAQDNYIDPFSESSVPEINAGATSL